MGKSSKNSKSDKNNDGVAPPMLEDRFSAAETRPQFKVPKASASKVVLDDRFSSVLTDPRFQLQIKDKYGRKKKKSEIAGAKEELESFYVVEDQEEKKNSDDDDSSDSSEKPEAAIDNDNDNDNDNENDSEKSESDAEAEASDDEKIEDPVSRIAYLTAFSRGELGDASSSEDDDSSQSSDDDDDSDGEDSMYGTPGVLDPSTKQNEEIKISYDSSPYLVVTNMDWENVRAVDLFSILSSFAPPGAIKKVQVFQSDFGMEQMAKDKLHGPTGIWQKKKANKQKVSLKAHSSDDEHSESEESISKAELAFREQFVPDESDFDSEKLRAYEASKLKYYFAVTECSQAEYADIIYREVDGMEFEHSSTAIDLRTLPQEALESVITDRPMRDEATSTPGKYEPPEFVVSALQQTNVKCTWDQGDKEREKKLTNYGTSNWQESFETDDLKAYLASDASSDEDSDDADEDDDDGKADKRSMMRKALGLESDSGSDNDNVNGNDSEASSSESDDDEGDKEVTMSKQIKIIPGRKDLEERIRSKLEPKEEAKELTPWEKYQEKRKQKRKERRQASRGNKSSEDSVKNSGNRDARTKDRDDFFANDDDGDIDAKFDPKNRNNNFENNASTKEELELLLAGEHEEEEARDYDIRGIQRMEKNKGKKLTGSRKRKEAKIAADVSGSSFKLNVRDDRFKSVLDGNDGRFGIDKTDPNFKDTTSMREILSEQSKRRKNKRHKKAHKMENVVPDVDVNNASGGKTSGASALSFLVQKLKSQVVQNKS